MSIRKKTLLIIGPVVVSLYAVFYVLTQYLILDSFRRLEIDKIKLDTMRTVNAIEAERLDLDKSNGDWAPWDNVYDYVTGSYEAFFIENCMPETLVNLRVNCMIFYNTRNELISNLCVDIGTGDATTTSSELLNFIDKNRLYYDSLGSGRTGVVSVGRNLMLLSSWPITRSDKSGEQVGTLVMTRNLDNFELGYLSSLVEQTIGIYPIDEFNRAENGAKFGQRLQSRKDFGGILIEPISDTKIYGYALLSDINNEPVAVIENAYDRVIYNFGRKSLIYFNFIAGLFLFILIAVMIMLLNKLIIIRIKRLQDSVTRNVVKTQTPTEIIIDGDDEITSLQRRIKSVLIARNESIAQAINAKSELQNQTRILSKALESAEKDKKGIENQRQATLNILEDARESQEDLANTNLALEKKGRELAALNSLSDELGGLLDIEEVIFTANKYLSEFLTCSAANYLVFDLAEGGGILLMSYLNKEVSEQFMAEAKNELMRFLDEQADQNLHAAAKVLREVNPRYFGRKLNNGISDKPTNKHYYFLNIGDRKTGLIQTVSSDTKILSSDDQDLVDAMIVTISFSLERLHSMSLTQYSKTVSLVESLSDGVVMLNNKKDIVLKNPSFTKYTGLTAKNLAINDLDNILKEIDLEKLINEALENNKISQINEAAIGEKVYELIVTPVKDNLDKVVGGAIIMHDVTHHKEVDRMKTEFVSVASHQLRTPLTAVKLFTEMLIKEEVGKLSKEQKEYLDNIYQSTERMARLVNDLLNITRIESGRLSVDPQPHDVAKLIRSIIKETEPLAMLKEVKIRFFEKNKNLPKIPLDLNHFRQVINNLLANAIRYSPSKKGKVGISLGLADPENCLIKVEDNGIGIPKTVQPRIFQKFFRADNAVKAETEGTGLGLYVCKMIVESSGGRVWFESEEGQGSVFFVSLPLSGMTAKKGDRGLVIS